MPNARQPLPQAAAPVEHVPRNPSEIKTPATSSSSAEHALFPIKIKPIANYMLRDNMIFTAEAAPKKRVDGEGAGSARQNACPRMRHPVSPKILELLLKAANSEGAVTGTPAGRGGTQHHACNPYPHLEHEDRSPALPGE